MRKERIAYPVFIKQCDNDYLVYIPDLQIYTEGDSFPDAMNMARDAIAMSVITISDNDNEYPTPSTPEESIIKAKADADEDFDYSDGVFTFVDVDCVAYRNKLKNRAVKKNCTIPFWLNEEAEKQDINFSQVLKEALMKKLNIG